ncbi:hypothetical protein EBU91_03480 [bacterium]|nr:hypothetical protein [bacterium]
MRENIKFPYNVRLYWKHGDLNEQWDEYVFWVIEKFGKPGEKYVTQVEYDFMDFMFKYEKDALFFSLKCL